MKKLLIFMLVLGIATVANATIMLSVNGDTDIDYIEIDICSTVLIDIHSDNLPPCYEAWLSIDRPDCGEWSSGMTIYPAAGGMATAVDWGDTWWKLTGAGAPPDEPEAGKHFEIEYHCTGCYCQEVTIILWDENYTVELDTVTIHQVPEPATIALLGLGGLFLVRRRK